MSVPPPTPSSVPPEKRALIEAYDQVLKAQAEKAAQEPKKPRRPIRPYVSPVLLVLSLGFAVYLAAAQPAWLISPPPPPESPATSEASLRLAMYATAQRVNIYRDRTGSLPDSLDQVPSSFDGVSYLRLADGYQLDGTAGPLHLTYHSTEPITDLVKQSYNVVVKRRTVAR
jgi:hypothetical protein